MTQRLWARCTRRATLCSPVQPYIKGFNITSTLIPSAAYTRKAASASELPWHGAASPGRTGLRGTACCRDALAARCLRFPVVRALYVLRPEWVRAALHAGRDFKECGAWLLLVNRATASKCRGHLRGPAVVDGAVAAVKEYTRIPNGVLAQRAVDLVGERPVLHRTDRLISLSVTRAHLASGTGALSAWCRAAPPRSVQ